MKGVPYEYNNTRVAVFGAGIAGLTAAHELIERGFQVEVYESEPASVIEQALDKSTTCAVGGMARTQWARAEVVTTPQDPVGQSTDKLELLLEGAVFFKPGTADFVDDAVAAAEIERIADEVKVYPNVRCVEVRGFTARRSAGPFKTGSPGTPPTDELRAVKVATLLKVQLKIQRPEVDVRATPYGLGHPKDWRKSDDERRYASFHVVEDWIPGEHGFRFFPSFYRNLFDTMRRTPIPDEDQIVYQETPRTALDNLIATEYLGISTEQSKKLLKFKRRGSQSLQELFDQLCDTLEALGHTLEDIARFQVKLFKYMTSCPRRRHDQYEHQSWMDFVDAEQFTPNFRKYLESTSEVLVGLKAGRSDARTYGNISVQMLQDQLRPDSRPDATLNGPTSPAWFDHWRRYLQHQGVRFYRGQLIGFVFFDGQPWPVVKLYTHDPKMTAPRVEIRVLLRDYNVLALPAKELQDLVKKHSKELIQSADDDFDRIVKFPLGDPSQPKPDGALEHMVGIQYYLRTDFRFLNGHIVFPDTPWRLSAVSQPQFWTQKRGWWNGYRGIVSVDISNMREAWRLTRQEIATGVWTQMLKTITVQIPATQAANGRDAARLIPKPILYHLDQNIELDRSGVPVFNKSPYLVSRVSEYQRRPGTPGAYTAHFGSLVLAGTFVQTHTRLTTMEAANESGRHAVNAILKASDYEGEGCMVWDPEENELPDLKLLVELDAKLHGLGLPHFVDILDLRTVPRDLLRPDLQALQTLTQAVTGSPRTER